MTQRTVPSIDIADLLMTGIKRTGKSFKAIAAETGVNYDTIQNFRKRRHGTNAAIFLEFLLRYPEIRSVVDEYLDLKTKQKTPAKHVQNVSSRLSFPQKEVVRL